MNHRPSIWSFVFAGALLAHSAVGQGQPLEPRVLSEAIGHPNFLSPVSYTHLTLPTILLV